MFELDDTPNAKGNGAIGALVLLKWVDSVQPHPRWQHTDGMYIDEKPMTCWSVGWLLQKTKHAIMLAPNIAERGTPDQQVSSRMVIPVEAVQECHVLNDASHSPYDNLAPDEDDPIEGIGKDVCFEGELPGKDEATAEDVNAMAKELGLPDRVTAPHGLNVDKDAKEKAKREFGLTLKARVAPDFKEL